MIIWVFGGTAVGKKQFMISASRDPRRWSLPGALKPTWMEDGDMSLDDIKTRANECNPIIRWQWGRENNIPALTGQNQRIILVQTPLHVQIARVVRREGELKWNEQMLRHEAENVAALVAKISEEQRIWVRMINGDFRI